MRRIAIAAALAAPLLVSANLGTNGSVEGAAQGSNSLSTYQNLNRRTGGDRGIEFRNNIGGVALDRVKHVEIDITNSGVRRNRQYQERADGPKNVPVGTSDSHSESLSAVSVTPAVPEPETYAVILAGLGVVGFVALRRRQT